MFFEQDGILYQEKGAVSLIVGFSNKRDVSHVDIVIPPMINGTIVYGVDEKAFAHTNIHSISLPVTVCEIGEKAFYNCDNLVKFFCESDNIKIKDLAFSSCSSLKIFSTFGTVEVVGFGAFSHCIKMERFSTTFINYIPVATFAGCHSLRHFRFTSITEIGANAFRHCDLRKVFMDNANFKFTEDYLKSIQNAEIHCSKQSKFANLAYEGYNVVCSKES